MANSKLKWKVCSCDYTLSPDEGRYQLDKVIEDDLLRLQFNRQTGGYNDAWCNLRWEESSNNSAWQSVSFLVDSEEYVDPKTTCTHLSYENSHYTEIYEFEMSVFEIEKVCALPIKMSMYRDADGKWEIYKANVKTCITKTKFSEFMAGKEAIRKMFKPHKNLITVTNDRKTKRLNMLINGIYLYSLYYPSTAAIKEVSCFFKAGCKYRPLYICKFDRVDSPNVQSLQSIVLQEMIKQRPEEVTVDRTFFGRSIPEKCMELYV